MTDIVPNVTRRTDQLLREIEAGALDSTVPLGDLLRRAVAIGDAGDYKNFHAWAERELKGYNADEDVPRHRRLIAPVEAALLGPFGGRFTQSLPGSDLDLGVKKGLPLRWGIPQIESVVTDATPGEPLRLQSESSIDFANKLNQAGVTDCHIEAIYWRVSPSSLRGIIEHVRTELTTRVAGVIAAGSDAPIDSEEPVITKPTPDRTWLKIAGSVLVGLMSVIGVILGLMQVQGWSFGEQTRSPAPTVRSTTSTSVVPPVRR